VPGRFNTIGGPADIVIEGIDGFLVDVEDSTRLADRLVEVLTLSDPKWRRMSDAALATATQYTWDDATDLLENALCNIICEAHRLRTHAGTCSPR
jgi:glycosyltransferase involved in cell wall biosynthesis